jgi:hypothetical protein
MYGPALRLLIKIRKVRVGYLRLFKKQPVPARSEDLGQGGFSHGDISC